MNKNYSLVFFIAALVIIFSSGCDINDILNNEKDKNADENSVEIGVNGGTITNEDLTITIPAGSFKETANIKVVQSDKIISGEDVVTKVYSIDGLPENYSLPIDVSIKISGTSSNETYLIFQTKTFTSSLGDVSDNSLYFESAVTGGIIKGQIPALPPSVGKVSSTLNSNSVKSTLSFNILGSTNKKSYTTNNKHFKIIYNSSKDNISNITNLGQYLEDAYSKIEGLGFNLNKRTSWPIKVQIEDLASNVYGYHCTSLWGINSYYLKFNRINLNSSTELKTTAIHEYFHFAQYLYDSRNVYSRAKFKSDQHWFNEACSVWSEELVAGPGYISDVRTPNTLTKPFGGLQAGSIGDATYHGYGMSAFVKYIVAKYGKNLLISIYDKIFSGKHVFDAINNSINYNLFTDYNFFLQKYAEGKIYNDLGYDRILAVREGMFRIQTESDTVKSFSANYKELSAKIFLVRLDNQNFQDDASLNLSVDQDMCDITVFGYPRSGGKLTLISQGNKNCTVTGLKNLVQEGKYLIVMVTNSNYISNNYVASSKNITLTFSISRQNSSELNSLLISSLLQRIYLAAAIYSASDGEPETNVLDMFEYDNYNGEVISSGFSENGKYFSLNSKTDSSGNNIYEECRVDFTFNDSRTEIVFIKAYKHRIDPTYGSNLTRDLECEFTIQSAIQITTTNLNNINDIGFMEYSLEKGKNAEFNLWVIEKFSGDNGMWTYKDTKGDNRLLKVQIQFSF